MPVTVGGSSGVTYADGTNTPASGVTARLGPFVTNTNNTLLIQSGVRIVGSSGVVTPNGPVNTARVAANIVISADTANYVLNTAKVSGYVAGFTDVIFTINSGIFVFSNSTGSYALTVDTSWNAADTITIVNNGTIVGMGGVGANSASLNTPGFKNNGGNAGPALLVQRATSINNGSGRIAGGGGGGGSGSFGGELNVASATGGGGGGGIGNGPGWGGYLSGNSGSLTAAGTGRNGDTFAGYVGLTGGNGGGYGSAGFAGQSGQPYSPGSGGAAGAAVVGNSNITWIATGTRNGSIS